jgi:hypothetical protein
VIDRELLPHERAALRAWAEGDVPDDFADEVLLRWDAEQEELPQSDEQPAVVEARIVESRIERRNARLAWWCGMVAAAAAILLALGMAWPRAVVGERPSADAIGSGEPSTELVALRTEARTQLLANCTPCHLGRAEGSKPVALAIFDLDDPRWHDALSNEQLAGAADRMADRGTPEEAAGFRRYVDAEIAHRRAR